MNNNSSSLKTKVISGVIWRFAERFGARTVEFVVSLILARLLSPQDYGTVALITVFTNILQVFVDSGLGNALIQKKDADDLDFSTVFYTNVVFCVLLYILSFICAPLISKFYGIPELKNYFRVLSITILISGIKNVQQAYVSRNMLFKRFFFSTLIGTIVAAICGVLMAFSGYGVWALIAQQIINLTIDTMILWITVKWRPKKLYSFARLKGLYTYGWKLLASALLDTVYNNLRQLIIGKLYSAEDLAFYNRGRQFPSFLVTNIDNSIDTVLLPAFSQSQDNTYRLKEMTRRSIEICSYIMAPLMVGLAVCSESLVKVLLTEKWLPAVPYLQIFCFVFILYPIHTTNLNAISALGRSDIFLKLEIIKKIIGMGILFITMRLGVKAMAYGMLASSIIGVVINSHPNRKLLHYKLGQQIIDILPNFACAIIMGMVVLAVRNILPNELMSLILQVLVGICCYILLSKITKNVSYTYLLEAVRNMKAKRAGGVN